VGGGLAAGSALLQTYVQRRSDAANRKGQEAAARHIELKQIYTRYQLAIDRLENEIRELSKACQLAISEDGKDGPSYKQAEKAYEPAQREYDEACEILKLLAPVKTTEVALQQRELFNGFVREALDGKFDFYASRKSIGAAGQPVLAAMRLDLGTPDKSDKTSVSQPSDP
jgi:hypothetical protein